MNIWHLDPNETYIIEGDETVRALLRQLRIPNPFAGVSEFDVVHAFTAFDNHPTHWIIIHLWQGVPNYSPNHSIHQFAGKADPNGLLFRAEPKATASRADIEDRLVSEGLRAGSKSVFAFQQLP